MNIFMDKKTISSMLKQLEYADILIEIRKYAPYQWNLWNAEKNIRCVNKSI